MKRPRTEEGGLDPGMAGGVQGQIGPDGFPCVRLRGLPFDVMEGDIKMFLVGERLAPG